MQKAQTSNLGPCYPQPPTTTIGINQHLPLFITTSFSKSIDHAMNVALAHASNINFSPCSPLVYQHLRLTPSYC